MQFGLLGHQLAALNSKMGMLMSFLCYPIHSAKLLHSNHTNSGGPSSVGLYIQFPFQSCCHLLGREHYLPILQIRKLSLQSLTSSLKVTQPVYDDSQDSFLELVNLKSTLLTATLSGNIIG